LILGSYRPDGADASDPDFAEALHLAAADRELGEWLARIGPSEVIYSAGVTERFEQGLFALKHSGAIACPRCAATDVERLSEYGSTPCKSLYRCLACREPFDYFKPY
jgi:hypothetical protein